MEAQGALSRNPRCTSRSTCHGCRELTTLRVARLDEGTELKVADPKEQQRDVEEEKAEGKERRDGVDWGRRRTGCCWRGGSFERLQCGG